MMKILRKGVILLVIFVAVVAGTSFLMNSQSTDNRSDMNDATLPEVMVKLGSTQANKMYGYRQQMQTDFMRGSITPLDTTKKVSFEINPYADTVTGLAYEVRTSDGSKVMENRKIKNLTKEDNGCLSTEIEIGSDLRMNQEYSMQITLDTSEGEVYYYTRVVSRTQLNTEAYLQFVKDFSTKCLDKEQADTLTGYLEAEDISGGTNYNNISISSGLSNISWGSLSPKLYMEGVPLIDDINETTASITLDYQVSAQDDEGKTEIYDVTEFYRMRYTETRIMLLDFKRSATKVFDPSQKVVSDAGLLLGVRDKNVTYASDSSGKIVAFEQDGDLWSYAPSSGKITRIFSFRKDENNDSRYVRTEHDIKIIRVSDSGDVDFVLYGYMNRGVHEGYSGVCVYHYNSDRNVVEEKVFIPSTESYEFLKEDLGTLTYVNKNNQLFLLFAQKLYQVDIETGTSEILEDDIKQKMISLETENAVVDQIVQGLSVDLHTCVSKVCSSELNYEEIKNRLISELSSQILDSVQHMNLDNLIVQEAGKAVKAKTKGSMLEMFLNDEMLNSLIQPVGGEIVKYINEKGPDFIKEELETKIDTLGEQSVIDLCNHMNISEGAVRKIVADFYHKAIDSVIGKLIGNLNIAEIIEDKINAMNVDSLEKLVLTVMKKELDTIVNLGALVGAVLGVLNIII